MQQQSLRKVICAFCCCEPALSARVSVHFRFLQYCVSGVSALFAPVDRVSQPQPQLLRSPRHTLQAMLFVLGDEDEAWWPGSLTNPFPRASCLSLKVQACLSDCTLCSSRSSASVSGMFMLSLRHTTGLAMYVAVKNPQHTLQVLLCVLRDRGEAQQPEWATHSS